MMTIKANSTEKRPLFKQLASTYYRVFAIGSVEAMPYDQTPYREDSLDL